MSFGRWLLIHSFPIFLLLLAALGYLYRAELQLEKAYQQLLNMDPKSVTISTGPATMPEPNSSVVDQSPINVPPVASPQRGKADEVTEPQLPLRALPTVPTVDEGAKPAMQQPKDTLEELLFLARKAYWDKNYLDAILFYQQLIQANRYNPDYHGELGNIYYSLNDNQNASRLYYQAARLFIEQQQPERARLLLSPITAMDRELGDELKRHLH